VRVALPYDAVTVVPTAPDRATRLRLLAAFIAALVSIAGLSGVHSTTAQSPHGATSTIASLARRCTAPTGVTNIELRGGGAVHDVRIFVPSAARRAGSKRLAVVIDWPGLGLTGLQEALVSNYETLAQAQGFVVVHPTGLPTEAVPQNSWELVNSYDPNRDDLAFADTLIDSLIAHWCVDPARVYSTGYSNGAFFTARLACERANRIAGAVMVAGVFHPAGCKPARPVPMYAYDGTADATIPYDGGGKSALAESAWPGIKGFFDNVIPDEFAKFATDFKCNQVPKATLVGPDVIRHDYVGCKHGVPMSFFEVVGGGHTWPGSPLASVLKPFGNTSDTVNATTDAWAFLKTQSLGR